MHTLNESLSLYTKSEKVSGYSCEKCKKKNNDSTVSRKIIKLPEIIIIQLQRFTMYPRLRKIRGQIEYSEFLDIKNFLAKDAQDSEIN